MSATAARLKNLELVMLKSPFSKTGITFDREVALRESDRLVFLVDHVPHADAFRHVKPITSAADERYSSSHGSGGDLCLALKSGVTTCRRAQPPHLLRGTSWLKKIKILIKIKFVKRAHNNQSAASAHNKIKAKLAHARPTQVARVAQSLNQKKQMQISTAT